MTPERGCEPDSSTGAEGTCGRFGSSRLGDEVFLNAQAMIVSRQNVSPKRLVEPGPSPQELEALFSLAAAAPDHGLLTPWRFVIVPPTKRELLAEAFALALLDRDPGATLIQIEAARQKAHRAPLLILCVVRLMSQQEPQIPDLERNVSLGCAIQNLLLGAHALGYGSGLTSGQAMASMRMRELFTLSADERAVCFINVGTAVRQKPYRPRPGMEEFVRTL